MGVYIPLHEVAEKTLIECVGLKGFVTVGFTAGLERQAKRASQRVTQISQPKGQQVSLPAA